MSDSSRTTLSAMVRYPHTLDPQGLEAATQALSEQLATEARHQNAYLYRFPDGNVSLELEWVDPALLARTVIMAYLTVVAQSGFTR